MDRSARTAVLLRLRRARSPRGATRDDAPDTTAPQPHTTTLTMQPTTLAHIRDQPAARSSRSTTHEKAEPEPLRCPCRHSLASLILEAMNGEPPRSGWLSIMILRCAALMSALLLVSLRRAAARAR